MKYFTSVEEIKKLKKEELVTILSERLGICEHKAEYNTISDAAGVYDIVSKMEIEKHRENMILLMFDSALTLRKKKIMFLGAEDTISEISFTIIFKEIFSEKNGCKKLILAHNHPSGDFSPSSADIEMTKQFDKCCNMLDLTLLDHVVFSETGFNSMKALNFF